MLPRAYRLWTTDINWLTSLQGTDAVWNDAVFSPITSTNHITGTDTGKTYIMFLTVILRIEETSTPALDGNLASTF